MKKLNVSVLAVLATGLSIAAETFEITAQETNSAGVVVISFSLHPSEVSNIRCILTLPPKATWDGRFWGFGNGGWAGKVSANFAGKSAALTCDLGTSAYKREDNPVPVEILKDFGWRATHLATLEAKRLIREYYGRAPDKSYFTGASTGGGQGLCEAQRYPEDYDGIIAEVPGMDRLSRATPSWQIARLCKKHGCKWFSKAEKEAIYAAERSYFAKYEPGWVRGEFILNPIPTPDTLNGCWKEIIARNPDLAYREALWRELFEPVVVRGRRLEPGQVLGMEFENVWTFLLEKYLGPRKPSEVTEDELLEFADQFNHQFVNPDLSAFRKRGGKLIMYAALEDVSVPPRPVCEYYDAVVAKFGGLGPTREFFVHYLVPGRAHSPAKSKVGGCSQLRAKLMAWVERGEQPEALDFNLNHQPDCKLRIGYYPENSVMPVGKWTPESTSAPLGSVIACMNWTAAMRYMLKEAGVELTVEGGETGFKVGHGGAKATFALDDEGKIVETGTISMDDSEILLKRLADGSGVYVVLKKTGRRWKLSAFDPRREIAVFEDKNSVWRKLAYVSVEENHAAGTMVVTVNRGGKKTSETVPR